MTGCKLTLLGHPRFGGVAFSFFRQIGKLNNLYNVVHWVVVSFVTIFTITSCTISNNSVHAALNITATGWLDSESVPAVASAPVTPVCDHPAYITGVKEDATLVLCACNTGLHA